MNQTTTSDLKVVYLPVGSLRHYANNARQHSKHQVRQIASSIEAFGFTNPILIDRDHRVIAGHGRVAAARLLGLADVPTILLENLNEDQIRAYVIADNRLAEKAGWDKSILSIELQNRRLEETSNLALFPSSPLSVSASHILIMALLLGIALVISLLGVIFGRTARSSVSK